MNRWLAYFLRRVENYVFYFTIIFIILMVLIQALMINSDIRQYLSRVDVLEGEPYTHSHGEEDIFGETEKMTGAGSDPFQAPMEITLEIVTPRTRLKIMVNGEERATIHDKPQTIAVEAGDLVEVESDENCNNPAKVRVTGAVGLQQPRVGDEITVLGDNQLVGWAIPEDFTHIED